MEKSILNLMVHKISVFSFALLALCLTMNPLSASDGKLDVINLKEGNTSLVMDVTVSGRITDASGQPLPGVTVSLPGTTTGTATDLDGKYSLTVPEGSNLVFSFIGFETQTIAIGDRSVIDVVLGEDMASLDEVVVVGYGTQTKANLTGAVSTIDGAKVLGNRPVSNMATALQGTMPG